MCCNVPVSCVLDLAMKQCGYTADAPTPLPAAPLRERAPHFPRLSVRSTRIWMFSSASETGFCVVFLVIDLHSSSFTQVDFTESARFRTGSMDLTPRGLRCKRYHAHHDVPTGPTSARIRPRFALLNFFARQVPFKISHFLPRRCPAPLRPAPPVGPV